MNKLTLIISDEEKADDKKTAAYPRRRPRRIGRRRLPGLMNFWDLGMVKTGPEYHQWEMLDFQPSIPASYETSTAAFEPTYHNELLAKIFEVPVEEWKGYYKRIVPEMNYGIGVWAQNASFGFIGTEELLSNSNPNFTNGGLKAQDQWFTSGYVPAINTQDGSAYAVFSLTLLGESSLNKITATYDIDADAVDFEPAKKMEVYLVPSLPYARGRVQYIDSPTTYTQQLNDFFHLYDRGIFLTPSHPLYPYHTASHFVTDQGLPTTYIGASYTRWAAITDYMKDMENARARYSTAFPPSFTSSDDGTAFGNIIADPYSPGQVPTNTSVFSSLMASNNPAFLGNPVNQTRLRCVIRQDGQFYYVWNVAYT